MTELINNKRIDKVHPLAAPARRGVRSISNIAPRLMCQYLGQLQLHLDPGPSLLEDRLADFAISFCHFQMTIAGEVSRGSSVFGVSMADFWQKFGVFLPKVLQPEKEAVILTTSPFNNVATMRFSGEVFTQNFE